MTCARYVKLTFLVICDSDIIVTRDRKNPKVNEGLILMRNLNLILLLILNLKKNNTTS